jgi:hypothetical protein
MSDLKEPKRKWSGQEIAQEVDKIIEARIAASPDGSHDSQGDIEAIEQWLLDHPGAMKPGRQARALWDARDKARRPILDDPELFDGDGEIPTGAGRRVKLNSATIEDLNAWQEIVKTEYAAATAAYELKMKWIAARRRDMSRNQRFRTLGQVMAKKSA